MIRRERAAATQATDRERAAERVDALTLEEARDALFRIVDEMYPVPDPDAPDHEWSADTTDAIARTLDMYGLVPESEGGRPGPSVRTYTLEDLTVATLVEVAAIAHERSQPAVWAELARREIGEHERVACNLIVAKLTHYKSHRADEATLWARAIYPLLALAELGEETRAFSRVEMAAGFGGVEIRGVADGALARHVDEDARPPYFVVIEAERGVSAPDLMARALGAMLCAARLSQGERKGGEIFGCYTIADVWTFLRGTVDWDQPKPVMSVLSSREYVEKTEAVTILAILPPSWPGSSRSGRDREASPARSRPTRRRGSMGATRSIPSSAGWTRPPWPRAQPKRCGSPSAGATRTMPSAEADRACHRARPADHAAVTSTTGDHSDLVPSCPTAATLARNTRPGVGATTTRLWLAAAVSAV